MSRQRVVIEGERSFGNECFMDVLSPERVCETVCESERVAEWERASERERERGTRLWSKRGEGRRTDVVGRVVALYY